MINGRFGKSGIQHTVFSQPLLRPIFMPFLVSTCLFFLCGAHAQSSRPIEPESEMQIDIEALMGGLIGPRLNQVSCLIAEHNSGRSIEQLLNTEEDFSWIDHSHTAPFMLWNFWLSAFEGGNIVDEIEEYFGDKIVKIVDVKVLVSKDFNVLAPRTEDVEVLPYNKHLRAEIRSLKSTALRTGIAESQLAQDTAEKSDRQIIAVLRIKVRTENSDGVEIPGLDLIDTYCQDGAGETVPLELQATPAGPITRFIPLSFPITLDVFAIPTQCYQFAFSG